MTFIRPSKRARKRSTDFRKVMAEVREAVMARANGRCEGCLEIARSLECDHFLGGSGRRRQMTTVENCWALCGGCHRRKTDNYPSREHWEIVFDLHCKTHGVTR